MIDLRVPIGYDEIKAIAKKCPKIFLKLNMIIKK